MMSLYASATEKVPAKTLTIEQLIHQIRHPDKGLARLIDDIISQPDPKQQSKLKTKLPGVTVSGEFSARSAKGLEQHSGLYIYDLDDLNGDEPETIKQRIAFEPSLVCAFVSPRRNGVKIILRGEKPDSAKQHKQYWNVGARLVETQTQCEVDRSGSDVSRLCYLAIDPEPVIGQGTQFHLVEGIIDFEDTDGNVLDFSGLEGGWDVPSANQDFDRYTYQHVREMLWAIGSDMEYTDWRNAIWSVMSHLGDKAHVKRLILDWSVACGGAKAIESEAEIDKIWDGYEDRGVTLATLMKMAKEAGWQDWRSALMRDEDGVVIKNEYNLSVILTMHPDYQGRFYADSITGTCLMEPLDRPAVCMVTTARGGVIEDHLGYDILAEIQSDLGYGFRGHKVTTQALMSVAERNPRNIRGEWLESLEWDGQSRLESMFIKGFGAEDTNLNRGLGRAFLGGAAARILKPGSPVQVIPIISGPQGCGKSSGIACLCPEVDWFCDSMVDMSNKDGYEVVRRSAIIELSELSSMRRSEIQSVKQFVVQNQIRWRGAYKRQAQDVKASWVFIGTTNDDEFLKDRTGNRRFVPVIVDTPLIDKGAAWIKRHREQLWAEAVTIARAGLDIDQPTWDLPKDLWKDSAEMAEKAMESHPWDDLIQNMDQMEGAFSLEDLAVEAGITIRHMSDMHIFGRMLKEHGWSKKRVWDGNKRVIKWQSSF